MCWELSFVDRIRVRSTYVSAPKSRNGNKSMKIDEHKKLKSGKAEPYMCDKNEGKCTAGGKGRH